MGLEWELNTKDVSGPSQSLKDKAGFLNKFPVLLGDAWGEALSLLSGESGGRGV